MAQYRTKDLVAALRKHEQHSAYVDAIPSEQLSDLIRKLRAAATLEAPCKEKEIRTATHTENIAKSQPAGARRRGRSSPSMPASSQQPQGGVDITGQARGSRQRVPDPRMKQPNKLQQERPPLAPPSSASEVSGSAVCKTAGVWPADAWNSWCMQNGGEGGDASVLFDQFRTSRGTDGISRSFAQLLVHARRGLTESLTTNCISHPIDIIKNAVGSQRRLARVLWERLDSRRCRADYCKSAVTGLRAVVVGAGPVGLRAALELRLLGADVIVLERRFGFDRINRLHLWSWCAEDLKGWGAKVFEPPELSFGADADFLHIGIGELQMLLFKCCLLLGVQVFFGAEFVNSLPSRPTGAMPVWDIVVNASVGTDDKGAVPPGPQAPTRIGGLSVLIGADGPRSSVAKAHSFDLQVTASLRREAALGLVANYTNRQTKAEKGRRSFSLARQYYAELFKECEQKTGVTLENIVCYISSQTHYFVMTPTRRSLQTLGVVKPDAPEGQILNNIDQAELAKAAKAVAAFPWKHSEPALPDEALDAPVGAASLFDFSQTKRAASGIQVLESSLPDCPERAKLLIALCGDSLIEPFWPEGLGIIRGFFAALDLASAVKLWAQTHDAKAATEHFEAALRQLKSLAGKTRNTVLRPDEQAYSLEPSTRYKYSSVEVSRGRSSSMPAVRVGR